MEFTQNFLEIFLEHGLFVILFVWLLYDSKKDSREREHYYRETLNSLRDSYRDLAREIKVNRIN